MLYTNKMNVFNQVLPAPLNRLTQEQIVLLEQIERLLAPYVLYIAAPIVPINLIHAFDDAFDADNININDNNINDNIYNNINIINYNRQNEVRIEQLIGRGVRMV